MTNGVKRPNILVLMTDQQRFDALGCAGNPAISTPNLDRLAAEGAMFRSCYAQNPICSPSRASFATGLYPHAHGLWANGVELPEDRTMVSRSLAGAGYDCGMAGKQHLAPCANGPEPRREDGYRVYKWSHDPIHRSAENAFHRWLEDNHPDIWSRIGDTSGATAEAGNIAKGATAVDVLPVEAHYSHWIAEEVIAFIGERRDAPFYFMANFFDPHHPFGAPAPFRALYDAKNLPGPVGGPEELETKPLVQSEYHRKSYGGQAPGFAEYTPEELREARAGYFAMVSMIDAEVGRILEALEASGQRENTIVIFSSDHGEMLGDHGIMLKGPMLYDALVRVPLIVRWPGQIAPGQRREEIVQLIDLTATLLEAAGAGDAQQVQGESLLPMLCGGDATDWRDWALAEYRDSGHSATPPVFTTMLREKHMKLVVWHGAPTTQRPRDGELYDLGRDPTEQTNLYNDPAYRLERERMKDSLLDVLVATEWPRPARKAQW
ncbi:sulfatase-like hydrolase/transferase [Martelella mediterranea]|uniref:sulfatase-like hydrolase/transferase n=1 Tax=Martelella mediterranea TaxID=293089 RepID=UPI001E46A8C5|nr:sulfatase-like hydrolase/transferase [Martelella mediterranea]MCD1635812.1 sulfatase-like hydrolase/transferase [Martelella mediterranea]